MRQLAAALATLAQAIREAFAICWHELRHPGALLHTPWGELRVRPWTADKFVAASVAAYPLPKAGDTVLDIGAHIGAYTLRAAAAGARVIAFEPEPDNVCVLRQNVAHLPAVRVEPFAIAATTGERTLGASFGRSTGGWSLLKTRSIRTVRCVSLEDVWRQWSLDRVALLKMDIEGSEYEVLLSAPAFILSSIDRVVVEVHDNYRGHNVLQLVGRLEQSGFSVRIQRQRLFGLSILDANHALSSTR